MRYWKPASIITVCVLCCAVVAGGLFFGFRPLMGAKIRPLTDRKFDPTVSRRERGRYLVESVARCPYCHSELDWSSPGAPPTNGKALAGRVWTPYGFPWLVSPNLTSDKETGAGSWTDDMLARSVREGIGHDGRALFPTMPYQSFRNISDEDLASIVVYLRSIPSINNRLPVTSIPFPSSRLILNAPQPIENSVPTPNIPDQIARGAYLERICACEACHTIQEVTGPISTLSFAGGFLFQTPIGTVASPNITPDSTGISYYDEDLFVQVLRTGFVRARKLNPEMPWGYFRGMTDEDIKAIFAYVRTLKPIRHSVDNTMPPTYCRICKHTHGAGDRN